MRSRILTLLTSAALLAALPAAALAAASDVHRDCADNGRLDKKHSSSDLKKAKSSLPSDLDEYTDCRAAINKGLSATASTSSNDGSESGGGSGGSGGSGTADKIASATGSGGSGGSGALGTDSSAKGTTSDSGSTLKPKAVVAGRTVEPGKNGLFKASNATNELPLPILLALIGVALLTAAGGLLVMKRRGIAPNAALRFLRR
ncbi:MAG: hypothetical protein H0V29_12700 [Thermoleophilaceae bacterium]|nr:hypothetical protein [Thermoleophilaceae bacterium]